MLTIERDVRSLSKYHARPATNRVNDLVHRSRHISESDMLVYISNTPRIQAVSHVVVPDTVSTRRSNPVRESGLQNDTYLLYLIEIFSPVDNTIHNAMRTSNQSWNIDER
jgi:hypothetical protein